jgi:ATP-dependent 26S proteasome regulatory subunit
MARDLTPAMIVLEDVDLVAQERVHLPGGRAPLLFELMNEMDGLADDADIIFVLTTNRPDLLEPALAARPGRIDEAVDFALPDPECRRRLIELYRRGLEVRASRLDDLVERTEGVSAAFIKELLRKAALVAAEQLPGTSRRKIVVEDHHFDQALAAMAEGGATLMTSLVGAAQSPGTPGARTPAVAPSFTIPSIWRVGLEQDSGQ